MNKQVRLSKPEEQFIRYLKEHNISPASALTIIIKSFEDTVKKSSGINSPVMEQIISDLAVAIHDGYNLLEQMKKETLGD